MQKCKFVEAISGVSKSGRPYSFVKLSDGLATFTVSNPKNLDFSKYVKGSDVNLEFEVTANYKGEGTALITKIS